MMGRRNRVTSRRRMGTEFAPCARASLGHAWVPTRVPTIKYHRVHSSNDETLWEALRELIVSSRQRSACTAYNIFYEVRKKASLRRVWSRRTIEHIREARKQGNYITASASIPQQNPVVNSRQRSSCTVYNGFYEIRKKASLRRVWSRRTIERIREPRKQSNYITASASIPEQNPVVKVLLLFHLPSDIVQRFYHTIHIF